MTPRLRSNYRDTEVRALIESYEELREKRDTKPGAPLRALLTLADIDRELSRLPRKEQQALLLVGKAGITTRTGGVLIGVTAMEMSRRYQSGMERLVTYLNGAYGH
jgi:DNA-directed RNA polymerase specialized sigma24 family protein